MLGGELRASGVKLHHRMAASPQAGFFPALGLHFSICKMGVMPPSPPLALDHFQELFPFQACVVTPFAHGACAVDIRGLTSLSTGMLVNG